MRAIITMLAVLLAAACVRADDAPARLRVIKHGEHVFIRSAFSAEDDLVVKVGKGTNRQINFRNAYLIGVDAGMSVEELGAARIFHANGDDATPWNLNGTYIGANHGCSSSREIVCPDHGRTVADLGTVWKTADGGEFVLMKIVDDERLWFLSVNLAEGDIWKFNGKLAAPTLTREDGEVLNFTDVHMVQLTPACRIAYQEYLVNGNTDLAEGEEVSCDYFDIVEEYDIINPGSLVQDMMDHPGEERSFVGEDLEGVVRNEIVYRFHPNGANVIYYNAEALQDFNIGYMGFIQSGKLTMGSEYTTHEYYVPKALPFTQDDIEYDFRAGQDYSGKLPSALSFSAANENVSDPANLPERFIQFLGHEEDGEVVRDVGYALGYSLVNGITVPAERAANAGRALMLYTSSKTYPTAADSAMGNPVLAGTEFECVAYRHYFYPQDQGSATCVYWHEESGSTVVYADFHTPVEEEALALPDDWAGRSFTVVEKSESVTLHAEGTVPEGGLAVSVAGDHGALVLLVD